MRRKIVWTREMDALLGTATDAHVAAKIGVSLGAVNSRRRLLGVQATRKYISAHHEDHTSERLGDTALLPSSTLGIALIDWVLGSGCGASNRIIDRLCRCDIDSAGERLIHMLGGESSARAALAACMASKASPSETRKDTPCPEQTN